MTEQPNEAYLPDGEAVAMEPGTFQEQPLPQQPRIVRITTPTAEALQAALTGKDVGEVVEIEGQPYLKSDEPDDVVLTQTPLDQNPATGPLALVPETDDFQRAHDEAYAQLDPRTRDLYDLYRSQTKVIRLTPDWWNEEFFQTHIDPETLHNYEVAQSTRATVNIVPDNAEERETQEVAGPATTDAIMAYTLPEATPVVGEENIEVPASFADVVSTLKNLSQQIAELAKSNKAIAAVQNDLVLKDTTLAALQTYAQQAEAEGFTPQADSIPFPSINYTGLTKEYVTATYYAQYLLGHIKARSVEAAQQKFGNGDEYETEKKRIGLLFAPYTEDIAVDPDHLQVLQDAVSAFAVPQFEHAGVMSDPEGNVLGIVGLEPEDETPDDLPLPLSRFNAGVAQQRIADAHTPGSITSDEAKTNVPSLVIENHTQDEEMTQEAAELFVQMNQIDQVAQDTPVDQTQASVDIATNETSTQTLQDASENTTGSAKPTDLPIDTVVIEQVASMPEPSEGEVAQEKSEETEIPFRRSAAVVEESDMPEMPLL